MDVNEVFLIYRVYQEEDFNVYNMHNIVDKHFIISIVSMQSRNGSLVENIYVLICIKYFTITFIDETR
jgi:hypothetical protein